MDPSFGKPSWLDRLSALLSREPEDREALVDILHGAFERNLMDGDALSMIEGVLQVSEQRVGDIMVPRSQIDSIDVNQSIDDFMPMVLEAAHSRFPVFDKDSEAIIGILLAKDLLRHFVDDEFNLRDMLRPAVFIPESKRLNVLLKEFRANRNHMAIVVDEYGNVAGLVTIEDVIEQIVGDIEDEYDFDETEDHIVPERAGRWRIKAVSEIADVNEALGVALPADEFDTLGGLVTQQFGHLPKRGETVTAFGLTFTILRADSRRLHIVLVSKTEAARPTESN